MNAARLAWIVGGAALLASLIGAIVQPRAFAFAWLAAVTTWLRWPLGCLVLLLVHGLTGGRWGVTVRQGLMQGVRVVPLLLPAIIPLLFVLSDLYPWLRAGESARLDNGFYLNAPFAAGRWIFYLVVWFGLGAVATGRLRRSESLTAISAPGLILLGLTVNFAAIDSIMALDPQFNSGAFGMINAAESGLIALAVAILATMLCGPVPQAERDDLGKLLQSLLILWAYLDFMQLLIVWQSDLPKEAAWYLARSTGWWGALAGLTAVAHFLLPFSALMMPRVRRSRRGLIATTTLLIVMAVIRGWWLVLPAHERGIGWIDVAAVLAFGGISVGLMLRGPAPRWWMTHA
ncbi:MAG: hypothetical protein P4L90_23425 [Rhodopila sp.]|nr:hypothetical protein [Rhodopila sp.]